MPTRFILAVDLSELKYDADWTVTVIRLWAGLLWLKWVGWGGMGVRGAGRSKGRLAHRRCEMKIFWSFSLSSILCLLCVSLSARLLDID